MHPRPLLSLVAVLGPYQPGIPTLLFLSQLQQLADHRGQGMSSQVTQYWFDSPTHPHPISFNLILILLGCTAPAGSFKQITG